MRRGIDICVAVVVLPLLTPIFLLIGLAVMIESPGGPFYGGWRVGKDGRQFRIWKFRTMVANADRLGTAITTRRDARITRVGWFLRKTKLDEVPQFINLLMGDLTLIGPRPEDPNLAELYTPEQREIFTVTPGITGPTQLKYTLVESEVIPDGCNAQQFYIDHLVGPKVRLDLEYLKKRTFLSDLQVLFRTLSLIVRTLTEPLTGRISARI